MASLSEVIFKRKHNINSTSWIVQSAVVLTVVLVEREELQTKGNKLFHNFHIITGSVFNNHWEKSHLGASKNEFHSSGVLSKFLFTSFNGVKVWTATEGRPNPGRNMWNNKWKVTWRRGAKEYECWGKKGRETLRSSWVPVGHSMLVKKRKKEKPSKLEVWGLQSRFNFQAFPAAFQALPAVYLFWIKVITPPPPTSHPSQCRSETIKEASAGVFFFFCMTCKSHFHSLSALWPLEHLNI